MTFFKFCEKTFKLPRACSHFSQGSNLGSLEISSIRFSASRASSGPKTGPTLTKTYGFWIFSPTTFKHHINIVIVGSGGAFSSAGITPDQIFESFSQRRASPGQTTTKTMVFDLF